MLEGFHRPYPDECWYSTMARFAARARYSKRILKEITGHRRQMLRLDFPEELEWFVSQLPSTANLTTDRIIQRHTAYPVFAPFLELSLKDRLLGRMRGDRCSGRLTLQQNLFGPKEQRFRYCLVCAQEDRARFGETYWHREHQLNAVVVCASHAVFLETYQGPEWPHRWQDDWIIAERAIRSTRIRKVDLTNDAEKWCLDVACDVAEVWAYNGPVLADEDLNQVFYWFAAEKGLLTYTDTYMNLECQHAVREVLKRYSKALVMSGYSEEAFSKATVYTQFHVTSKHPVYHVLLARFLGQDIKSILKHKEVPHPFGAGPWPCWNVRARHYGKRVVTTCTVEQDFVCNPPIGTFSCECGCTYSRAGPDRLSTHAVHQSYVIRAEGQDEAEVVASDPNSTSSAVATSSTESRHTATRGYAETYAVDLRSVSRSLFGHVVEVTVLRNRRAWLCGTDLGPRIDWRKARYGVATVFNTLLLYDPDWLSAHLPRRPLSASIWNVWGALGARDEILAAAIFEAGKRLRRDPDFKGPIDRTAIATALHVEESNLATLRGLSYAQRELSSVTETSAQYFRRCIWHTLHKCKQRKSVPTAEELLRESGVPLSAWNDPAVLDLLDFALHRVCPAIGKYRGETLATPRFNQCPRCQDIGFVTFGFVKDEAVEPYLRKWLPLHRVDRADIWTARSV